MAGPRSDLSSSSFLDEEEFDYVVVGGGTAGLVVATRLTEDPSVRVLVLEAGKDRRDDFLVRCPGMMIQMYGDPEYDWDFLSKPQEAVNGRRFAHPAGKMLGGSSALNIGMMIYPSKSGFDGWEKLGNPGWDWDTMVPYFRKFHTWTPPSEEIKEKLQLDYIRSELHGVDGPIKTGYHQDGYSVFNEAWPRTFQNLGQMTTADPVSGVALGAFGVTGTLDPATGERSHAGNAYFDDKAASRPNLRVVTEAEVSKIILEDVDGSLRATGVTVTPKDGLQRTILAKAEVILAAGAINTPKLLELSGIGDGKLLESLGIDVKVDNPNVGENLQDHGLIPMSWEVADGQISADIMMKNPEIAQQLVSLWQNNNGAGPLGTHTITSSFMPPFDLDKDALNDLFEQNLQPGTYKDFPSKTAQYALLREILQSPDDASAQITFAPFQVLPEKGPVLKDVFGMSEPGMYVSAVAVLNHPFSRGSTHITSADPKLHPELSVGLLEHPLDIQLHARHIQFMEKIAETDPMKSLLKKGGRRLPPLSLSLSQTSQDQGQGEGEGEGEGEEKEEEEAKMSSTTAIEVAKQRITPHYHLCGTAAMMKKELGGVVDAEMRVYGVKSLRVVDASVFPLIPRGNIQSSVYAVAERGADIIRGGEL